jgi:ribosomal protein S18 acetylase RimI-like enzyme
MVVSELTSDDARAYQELRLFALQESPTAFSSSYDEEINRSLDLIKKRLGDEVAQTFGSFNQNGELIGMATLYREQHKKNDHRAFLFGMYVSPEYRGQGVGKVLLEKVIARARALGLRQINLSVNNANEVPVRFYESFGFERFGLEKDAMRIGEEYYDAAYMVLRLEEGA